MKSVLIIIPYFGKWPSWMSFFLESCRWNPTVNWLLLSDCGPLPNKPSNVELVETSFSDYKQMVSRRLGVDFSSAKPYKLCDLKPAYGFVHADRIKDFDYYGYGDLDLVYGDIRAIYDDDILTYDMISSHRFRVAGHLALFKNTPKLIEAFRYIRGFDRMLVHPEHMRMAELLYTRLFLPARVWVQFGALRERWWLQPLVHPKYRSYFQEQYSTVLAHTIPWLRTPAGEYPERWFWKKGKLTTEDAEAGQMLYLHFMNWKGSRYLRVNGMKPARAAWEKLDSIVHVSAREPGWMISPAGFTPLPAAEAVRESATHAAPSA